MTFREMFVFLAMCAVAASQAVPPNNRAVNRGATPTQMPSQNMDRGRLGTEASVPAKPSTWRGILVDAGCQDRSSANLRRAPALAPAAPPDNASADPADTPNGRAAQNGAVSGKGINVDTSTAQAERSDPMETHTQDHLTRQMDSACSITAGTKAYALLLKDGTLLNLDEGGNTKAFEAFQSSRQGQDILNGHGSGDKPRAAIKGMRRGDKLEVDTIRLM